MPLLVKQVPVSFAHLFIALRISWMWNNKTIASFSSIGAVSALKKPLSKTIAEVSFSSSFCDIVKKYCESCCASN